MNAARPRIRSASEADLAAVLDLWRLAGNVPTVTDSEESLRALIAVDSDALLVAEASRGVVGSLIVAWNGWRGSFYRLAVHPEERRRGIATALLHEGERRLRARGAVRVDVIAVEHEEPATGFWSAAGYDRRDEQVRFVRDRGETGPNAAR